jgi:glycosyltransferase involved in cell wall biosynthesis
VPGLDNIFPWTVTCEIWKIYTVRYCKTMRKVKVFHLITELSIGGAQNALFRLLENFGNASFQHSVACFFNADGTIANQIRALNTPVFDLRMNHKYQVDAFGRLLQLLRREKPDILHTWMFHANLPGRILGRLAKIPIIISSERTMGQENSVRHWLNKRSISLVDQVICVSQSVADHVIHDVGLPSNKVLVIPNGIDPARYQNLPAKVQARISFGLPVDSVIIAAIGRPRPVKGYPYLLKAFVRISKSYPRIHLLFVGNGPDRPKLIDQAQSLGMRSRVTFLDDLTNIPDLLASLDVLVIPSLFEGMPNVALEAMAVELPVVATAVGGTPEVVIDGKTGFLIPSSDTQALSIALEKLIENPPLRDEMGLAGRRRVEREFSIKKTVHKTRELYANLLTQKRMASS